ncbi:hypothetical protein T484DRAFT_1927105 [Baffinella frigidus]|nr:hypothetical protein T484DRAFT_1927105 [Cryptophyta sp. CCMP2293]
MSAAQFGAVRADYIAGVAVAFGRAESEVGIVSVVEVATRRRLLSVSVLVETAVTVPAEEAESVASSVTPDNLNSALGSRGMTVEEVTDVAVSTAGSSDSTPSSSVTPSGERPAPDPAPLVAGIFAAVFVLGCVFAAWKRRKQLGAWYMKLRGKDGGKGQVGCDLHGVGMQQPSGRSEANYLASGACPEWPTPGHEGTRPHMRSGTRPDFRVAVMPDSQGTPQDAWAEETVGRNRQAAELEGLSHRSNADSSIAPDDDTLRRKLSFSGPGLPITLGWGVTLSPLPRQASQELPGAADVGWTSTKGSLDEFHVQMLNSAALLGSRFGRGGDETHAQEVVLLRFGDKTQAALGIYHLMGVDVGVVSKGMYEDGPAGRGVAAICREVEEHGTAEDKECLNYILREEAGSNRKVWSNGRMDCDRDGNILECRRRNGGHRGMSFADFLEHRHVQDSKLSPGMVLALRLYTTSAYKSINTPLRSQDTGPHAPHRLPVTVALIAEGIKLLRVVEGQQASSDDAVDLYRGMKGVRVPKRFVDTVRGGAEVAPMATTLDLSTALSYSGCRASAVLFRLRTSGSLSRGADVSFLSAFPGEKVILFPPLTHLRTLGKAREMEVRGIRFLVVDVEPILP